MPDTIRDDLSWLLGASIGVSIIAAQHNFGATLRLRLFDLDPAEEAEAVWYGDLGSILSAARSFAAARGYAP